jgi:hypothetical protein
MLTFPIADVHRSPQTGRDAPMGDITEGDGLCPAKSGITAH